MPTLKNTSTEAIVLKIPTPLKKRLNRITPKGQRTGLILQALEKELQWIERKQFVQNFLKNKQPLSLKKLERETPLDRLYKS